MEETGNYWQRGLGAAQASPNASLFRFLGQGGVALKDKLLLEVGFLYGADLLEAERRGAIIHGVDVNPSAVQRMQASHETQRFALCDVTRQPLPFDRYFDVVVCRDVIEYFNEADLRHAAGNVRAVLATDGMLVMQFPQMDLERQADADRDALLDIASWVRLDRDFVVAGNPMIYWKPSHVVEIVEAAGFILAGEKSLYETYGVEEKFMRCNKYFLFRAV